MFAQCASLPSSGQMSRPARNLSSQWRASPSPDAVIYQVATEQEITYHMLPLTKLQISKYMHVELLWHCEVPS